MAVLKREEESFNPNFNVNDVHTILGPESSFEGKLTFAGTVRLDGHFKGEIRTHNVLVVGQTARIDAQLHVGSVIIHGHVVGDIYASQAIEIHAPARVIGNLNTPQLFIAKGVVFEGTCKMEDSPSDKGVAPISLLQRREAE